MLTRSPENVINKLESGHQFGLIPWILVSDRSYQNKTWTNMKMDDIVYNMQEENVSQDFWITNEIN